MRSQRNQRLSLCQRSLLTGLALTASGCASVGAQTPPPPAVAESSTLQDYRLGVGDKIRLIVFNEPTLSAEYAVNANGMLAIPLIGDVQATGQTASEVRATLERRFGAGYLRSPHVSIDIMAFRPFYILGEVQKPGEYAFSSGLTVLKAVATAQGFTYRANTHYVYVKSPGDTIEHRYHLTDISVHPGDTIRIGQRFF